MRVATINLSLPKGLLEKVDREAVKEDRSRSELMRVALQGYLERKKAWDKLFAFADRHVKKRGLKPSDVETAVMQARKSG